MACSDSGLSDELENASAATRLLEKRRQMFEVQDALDSQKQDCAAKVCSQLHPVLSKCPYIRLQECVKCPHTCPQPIRDRVPDAGQSVQRTG